MKTPYYTRQFKKDLKLAEKRRKEMEKLKEIMTVLVEGQQLPEKHRDHPLRGDFAHYRECHVEPDWLLVYKKTPQRSISSEQEPIPTCSDSTCPHFGGTV